MSSRNRVRNNNRGSNGNQEEVQLWNTVKDKIRGLVDTINGNSEDVRAIFSQESYMAKNKDTVDESVEAAKLEALFRGGLRSAEASKEQIDLAIEQLQVLRALRQANEQDADKLAAGSSISSRDRGASGSFGSGRARSLSARGGGAREKDRDTREREKDKDRESVRERDVERSREKESERDPYEFDGGVDSPVPSPMGSHTKKLGNSAAGSDRSGNRDSVPPRGGDRDTPGKADSVPPETAPNAVASQQRWSKISFAKGQDVVFRPKQTNINDPHDWMLGRVQQVLGEGKSRRYKVQDADPDLPPEQRTEFRTSASSMIPMPLPDEKLASLEMGRTVLAEYPDSTTFYKAEVMGTDPATGKISLKFAGEENSDTLQLVERCKVVEYRP